MVIDFFIHNEVTYINMCLDKTITFYKCKEEAVGDLYNSSLGREGIFRLDYII